MNSPNPRDCYMYISSQNTPRIFFQYQVGKVMNYAPPWPKITHTIRHSLRSFQSNPTPNGSIFQNHSCIFFKLVIISWSFFSFLFSWILGVFLVYFPCKWVAPSSALIAHLGERKWVERNKIERIFYKCSFSFLIWEYK